MKKFWELFFISIKRGFTTPNLPENIIKLNDKLWVLRMLGGLSTLCLLGREQLNLNLMEILLAMLIGIIYIIYGMVITVIRIKYMKKV